MTEATRDQKKTIRPAAVAGSFYPLNPCTLSEAVEEFLESPQAAHDLVPKALIAPHAGYPFSGPIAGSAFGSVNSVTQKVVLIGPAHRAQFTGMALAEASVFDTPLGPVPVHLETIEQLATLPFVSFLSAAHAQEHSLEVELPFLQRILGEFSIIPVLVGTASDDDVAALLDLVWGGPETIIVVSSDLSHYNDYATAQAIDRRTAEVIAELQPNQIGPDQACGHAAIRGLLEVARGRKLRTRCLDLRNSGDTAGSRNRVVGYGAFVFS
jgi:AmmeMemoRadiSam system protein B